MKRIGMTVSLLGLAAATVFTPRGSAADILICAALGVGAALVALGGWLKGALSEWWANVDPNPQPPALKPVYWRDVRPDRDVA